MEALASGSQPQHELALSLHGEIDLDRVAELDAAFMRVVAAHPAVVRVDLSDVQFIDSTGLNSFLRWHHDGQRSGFHVVLVAPSDAVDRLLRLTHLDDVLIVER